MVAGVETGEHPPSSLEGVEQPSEASGGEKLELYLLLRLTSLSGKLLSATKTVIPSVLHFRGQKSFWWQPSSMEHHQMHIGSQ